MDILIADEFAFYADQSYILESLNIICDKIILASTKNDPHDKFYSLYKESKGESVWKSQAINWWDVPSRDIHWRNLTINYLSEKHFNREFLADF